ncbi:MAG: hypothetical protein ACT4OY_06025 [Alphaproteobacteria bacterium]
MSLVYRNFANQVSLLDASCASVQQSFWTDRVGRVYLKGGKPFVARVHAASIGEYDDSHLPRIKTYRSAQKQHSDFLSDQVYLGFAGFLNLSYIEAIKPAAVFLGDNNTAQKIFWKLFIECRKNNPDFEHFKKNLGNIEEQLVAELRQNFSETNGAKAYEKDLAFLKRNHGVFRRMGGLQEWIYRDNTQTRKHADRFWMKNEGSHFYKLVRENAVAPLTIDLTDTVAVQQLQDFMQNVEYECVNGDNISFSRKGASFGTIYVSNIIHAAGVVSGSWRAYDSDAGWREEEPIVIANVKSLAGNQGANIIDDLTTLQPKDFFEETAPFHPRNAPMICSDIKVIELVLDNCAYTELHQKEIGFLQDYSLKMPDYTGMCRHAISTAVGRAYVIKELLPLLDGDVKAIKILPDKVLKNIRCIFEDTQNYPKIYMGSGGLEELQNIANCKPGAAILFHRNFIKTLFMRQVVENLSQNHNKRDFLESFRNTASQLSERLHLLHNSESIKGLLLGIENIEEEISAKVEEIIPEIKTLFNKIAEEEYSYLHLMGKSNALPVITLDLLDTGAVVALEEALENCVYRATYFYQTEHTSQKQYTEPMRREGLQIGFINVCGQIQYLTQDLREQDNKRLRNLDRLLQLSSTAQLQSVSGPNHLIQ